MITPPQGDAAVPYYYSDFYLSDTFESFWHDLGNICSDYGLSKMAIFCFDNALKHKRKSGRNLYKIAKEFIILNSMDKLGDIILKLSEAEGTIYFSEVLSGHLCLSQNKIKESFLHFSKALEIGPPDFCVIYGIAKWNEIIKNYGLAFKYYSLLLRKFPINAISYSIRFRIMAICKMEGSIKHAKRFLLALKNEELQGIEKDSIEIQLASCFELLGENEQAILICRNLLLKRQNNIFLHRLFAWIYYKINDLDEALRCIEFGVDLFRGDPYLLYLKGKIHGILHNYEVSKHSLKMALDIGGFDPNIWNAFGIVLFKTKSYEQAEHCFKNGLKIDKDFFNLKYNLCLIYKVQNKQKDFKRLLEEGFLNNLDLLEIEKEFKKNSFHEHFECKEVVVNLAYTPYFAPHLFFGGSYLYVKKYEYENFKLNPVLDVE